MGLIARRLAGYTGSPTALPTVGGGVNRRARIFTTPPGPSAGSFGSMRRLSAPTAAKPYATPTFPEKVQVSLPYSTVPPVPGVTPPGQDQTELNLGNVIPYLFERPAVVAVAALGALVDSIGGRGAGDVVRGIGGGAIDVGAGAVNAVAGVAAPVLNIVAASFKDQHHIQAGEEARILSDPSVSLDDAIDRITSLPTASMKVKATLWVTVRQLRQQGLGDDAIRRIAFDSIELPDAVKAAAIADPKLDVAAAVKASPEGSRFTYGKGVGAEAYNMAAEIGALALEFAAGGGVLRAARAGLSAVPAIAPVVPVVGGAARIAMKVGRLNMAAGLAVWGGTKIAAAIAQTAGDQQAYDFLNRTLWTRPLSDDPATCFVGAFLFTGLEGFGVVARRVLPAVSRAGQKVAAAGLAQKIESISDLRTFTRDRLARMYAPHDPERGVGYADRFYSDTMIDTPTGKATSGAYDPMLGMQEIMGVALDIAIREQPLVQRAIWASIPDGIQRTAVMLGALQERAWSIVLNEPGKLADYWQTTAWKEHLSVAGVRFDPDAMGMISVAYRGMKEQTYALRQKRDAVVGMVDQVPPATIRENRVWLRDRYANPTDIVSNEDATYLLGQFPGYRDAMREVVKTDPQGIIERQAWTRSDLERAMDAAAGRFGVANRRDAALMRAESLPENAPHSEIAKAVGTDETTAWSILSEGEMQPSTIESIRRYLELHGVKTFDETAAMTATDLRAVAQEHLRQATGPLYEKGRAEAIANARAGPLRKRMAEEVAAGREEAAAATQREIAALDEMVGGLRDPVHVPFSAQRAGAVHDQDLADSLTRLNDNAARSAQAVRDLSRIDELEAEAATLLPSEMATSTETALQRLSRAIFRGRFVGGAPHWSEETLANMAAAVRRTAGFDNPIDAANWIRENWRHLDKQDRTAMVRAMGGGFAGRGGAHLDSILAKGVSEPSEWAAAAGRVGADAEAWEQKVVDLAERYDAALAGWGTRHAVETAAKRAGVAPPVSARLQVGFVRSLEMRMNGAPGDLYAELGAAKATMLDPATDSWTKIGLMTRYGFNPERASIRAALGIDEAWGTITPEFRVYEHPANVADLERQVQEGRFTGAGISAADEEAIASAIGNASDAPLRTSIFDTDPILRGLAVKELRDANRLTWVVDPRLRLVDWEKIDAEMAGRIAAQARSDIAKPVAGSLDDAILAGGSRDAEIDAAMRTRATRDLGQAVVRKSRKGSRAKARQGRLDEATGENIPPPVEADADLAERLMMQPVELPRSHQHAQQILGLSGSLSMRVDERVLAAPEHQRGMKALGALLHGSSAARPNTVEGALVALREIENGNARLAGIGEALQADAQRAAAAIVERAVHTQKAAGFFPGVVTKGLAPWMIPDADYALMHDLIGNGFTISDPAHGLQYGLKKRPQNVWKLGEAATPEELALAAETGHGGQVLEKAGAAAYEFEAQAALARERGVPGLIEELLAGRFETFGERLTNDATRRAYNLVFGERGSAGYVKSAFARDPFGYVFGKLDNQTISTFVHGQFVDRSSAVGVMPEEAEAVWRRWGQTARESEAHTEKFRPWRRRAYTSAAPGAPAVAIVRGGRPMYGTIHNIPNQELNATAREAVRELHAADSTGRLGALPKWAHDRPEAGAATVDFAYLLRTSASPVLRHLEDGFRIFASVPVVGGKVIGGEAFRSFGHLLTAPYEKAATNRAVKTLYYIFRFGMDIRFAAMEFIEPYALGAGRAAFLDARYTGRGLMAQNEQYLAHLSNEGVRIEQGFIGGGIRRFDVMYGVFEKERTAALEREVARLRREQPGLAEAAAREALASRKSVQEEAAKMGRSAEDPTLWDEAIRAAAESDPELAAAIRDFADGDVGRWLDELDGNHNRILSAADPVVGLEGEVADIIERNPHLSEVAAHVGEVNRGVWEDVRALAYGRMDRSRAERLLNHPLLFWPLSYQVRATAWLGTLLFRRFGGKTTNALGAYELDRMIAAHNEAMANDPEYRQFLERHRTLLFVASMMLPITPDQIGVSLSPLARDLFFDRSKNVAKIGPIYTITDLLPKATGELWRDIGSWEALHDTPLGEPIRRVANLAGGYPEWKDAGWTHPAEVPFNP